MVVDPHDVEQYSHVMADADEEEAYPFAFHALLIVVQNLSDWNVNIRTYLHEKSGSHAAIQMHVENIKSYVVRVSQRVHFVIHFSDEEDWKKEHDDADGGIAYVVPKSGLYSAIGK